MSRPQVLVVSPAQPHLDQLAVELARRGLLSNLIHPFLVLHPRLSRIAGHMPWIGERLLRELRIRSRPAGLSRRHVVLAGTSWELLRAALSRLPRRIARPLWRPLAAVSLWAVWRRNRALADSAARRLSNVEAVVVASGTGLSPFRAAPAGVLRCLEYPTAHWDVARDLLLEEARLNPEFAGTIEAVAVPEWIHEVGRREIEAADVIFVGSDFVRQTFIAAGTTPERLVVATYGVDLDLFAPDPEPDFSRPTFTAVFVGSIGQRKGISYLLDAWSSFTRAVGDEDTKLLLVGSFAGDPTPVLKRSGLFAHLPRRPLSELPAIYRRASAFVLPSIFEGMPLVVLQAMACGLPCIVTPNGPGDVVRDGVDGFVVPMRDSAAIADKLRRLAEDSELRQEMSRNARARALEYTWATYTDRILDGLRANLSGRGT